LKINNLVFLKNPFLDIIIDSKTVVKNLQKMEKKTNSEELQFKYFTLLNQKVELLSLKNSVYSNHLTNALSNQIDKKLTNKDLVLQDLNTRITNLTNEINEDFGKIYNELKFYRSIISLLFFEEKDLPDLNQVFDSIF